MSMWGGIQVEKLIDTFGSDVGSIPEVVAEFLWGLLWKSLVKVWDTA